MMTFGNPSGAYLLLLLPLLTLLWYWKFNAIQRAIDRWISPFLQKELVTQPSRRNIGFEWLVWNGIAALLIFAFMDPRGDPRYFSSETKVEKPSTEILFLVDVSASMNTADTRTRQSRFEIAKEIALQAVEQLSGDSIGVFGFTTTLTNISPPTFDLLFVHMMLSQMVINEGGVPGTLISSALEQLLPTLSRNSNEKTVVILTDGENTEAVSREAMMAVIDQMVKLKTTIQVVGVGSKKGGIIPEMSFQGEKVLSVPDFDLLQEIASRGRGNFFNSGSDSSLGIASHLVTSIRAENQGTLMVGSESHSEILYTHYRIYPLLMALFLLVVYRLFPSLSLFPFFCLAVFPLQGESAFAHALYQLQAGDLPQAAREWGALVSTSQGPWERSVAQYNLASVYIAQQKWQKAINMLDLIPLTNQTPEYLTYHVAWNKAWVSYQLHKPKEVILPMIEESKIAYCDWLKAIGAEDCSPPSRYEKFTRLVMKTPSKKPPQETFVYDPDPIVILERLIVLLEHDIITEVFAAIRAFEQRSMEVQREGFLKSCQFHPWNEVYPPFYEGVTLMNRDRYDQVLQAKAIVMFKEALEKLKTPPEKFKTSCWGEGNATLLQQVQSMNLSDSVPKAPQKIKGGTKPW